METAALNNLIIKTLEDNKAEDIISFDVHELTTITDMMIICSATSKRHAHALGDYVITKVKENGHQPLGIEGDQFNEWILIDLGEIVVHIMLPEVRQFYSLEKLWQATLKVREDVN